MTIKELSKNKNKINIHYYTLEDDYRNLLLNMRYALDNQAEDGYGEPRKKARAIYNFDLDGDESFITEDLDRLGFTITEFNTHCIHDIDVDMFEHRPYSMRELCYGKDYRHLTMRSIIRSSNNQDDNESENNYEEDY